MMKLRRFRQLAAELIALAFSPARSIACSGKLRQYMRDLIDDLALCLMDIERQANQRAQPSQALPDETDSDIDLSVSFLDQIEEESRRPPLREERTCEPIDLAAPEASPKAPTPADTSSPPKNGAAEAKPPTG